MGSYRKTIIATMTVLFGCLALACQPVPGPVPVPVPTTLATTTTTQLPVATKLPSAPRSVSAVASNGKAMLTWQAPADPGSSPITNYRITSLPSGAVTTVGAVLATIVPGLTNGNTYTFTVSAVSAVGAGPASAVSNVVTPVISNTLRAGENMVSGDKLRSSLGQYTLSMETNGNLALYTGGRAIWSTNTGNQPGAWARMQEDGNFVLYSAQNVALWNTHTGGGSGATYSAIQDDGNFVLYNNSGRVFWESGTTHTNILPINQVLIGDWALHSSNGQYGLIMQKGDGNLVLYKGGQAIWASQTQGYVGAWLNMQPDGNLVVYSQSNTPLWNTHTGGSGAKYLAVQDDGNLVLYDNSGAVYWASQTNTNPGGSPAGHPPASAQNIGYNPFAAGYSNQCTYYAEQRMADQTGMYMPVTGNAYQFADQASAGGWTVGDSPAINSVVVFPAGSFGSSVGHVGWVVDVNGSQLRIQDYNWNFSGATVTDHWVSIPGGTRFIYSDR